MYGSLNVVHVKHKAKASLIRTFMKTAAIPKYRHNLLHNTLYRFHVLDDDSLLDPGFLSYYTENFFKTIREVKETSAMDIRNMSIGQCYQALILADRELIDDENLVLDGELRFKSCRAEMESPRSNWSRIWKRSRMRGLPSELVSFNFKLLHFLLVP